MRYLTERSKRFTLFKPTDQHIETALVEKAVEKFSLKIKTTYSSAILLKFGLYTLVQSQLKHFHSSL